MKLSRLAQAAGFTVSGSDVEITGISVDSRTVRPGDLFAAVAGTRADGLDFVPDAMARGAAAVLASGPVAHHPTLIADDPRAGLARVSAAFFGEPAKEMRLVGITGTLGKTSTAQFLSSMLHHAGLEPGVIGSLGIQYAGRTHRSGMTTPDAPRLHEALRGMIDAGITTAVMEVTSHALLQHRVAGLRFALGVLTNLEPGEHLELHPSPEHYLRTKARFFELLDERAPLIVSADDALAWRMARTLRREIVGVSASGARNAAVALEQVNAGAEGTRFTIRIRRELPAVDGGVVEPVTLPIAVPVLGTTHVMNVALAATAARMLGAGCASVAAAAARMQPIRRRMEVVRPRDPMVVDDTVGNPRSLRAVFDTVWLLDVPGRTHLLFGIRGSRGAAINGALARALVKLTRRVPVRLVVTSSDDVATPGNRVTDDERAEVLGRLTAEGVPHGFRATLDAAVNEVLDQAGAGDLVLLLGAQGLDEAARFVRERLAMIPAAPDALRTV